MQLRSMSKKRQQQGPDSVPHRQEMHNEMLPSKKRRLTSQKAVAQTTDLCARCNHINWKSIASFPLDRRKIAPLNESHKALSESTCRICRLLANIKPPSLDGKPCSLRLSSAKKTLCPRLSSDVRWTGFKDSVLLRVATDDRLADNTQAMLRRGMIGLYHEGQQYEFGVQTVNTKSVNFNRLKDSLAHCREHHVWCHASTQSRPRDLRVIDCEIEGDEPKIVSAPVGCQYAALSYVWGAVPCTNKTDSSTKPPLALVVRQAMKATISMGLRYLWVDKHCINQDDAADKHAQISQMGTIYSSAEVTLIDAAGDNASHGLAGLGTVQRQRQCSEAVDGITLLQGFPHPSVTVTESTWASRGWTFQECFLSRRRVMFTKNGASYLCNRMHIAEWDIHPIAAVEGFSPRMFPSLIPQVKYTNRGDLRVDGDSSVALITDYSHRHLSYQSDSMNAFLGILDVLKQSSIHCLYGVPCWLGPKHRGNPYKRQFYFVIMWSHREPAERVVNYPSWSVLGWKGGVQAFPQSWQYGEKNHDICIGDADRPLYQLSSALMAPPAGKIFKLFSGDNCPRYLHVTGYLVETSVECVSPSSERIMGFGPRQREQERRPLPLGMYARFQYSFNTSLYVPILASTSSKPRGRTFALYLDDPAPKDPAERALILEEYGNVLERIGIIRGVNPFWEGYWVDSAGSAVSEGFLAAKRRDYWYQIKWLDERPRRTVVIR